MKQKIYMLLNSIEMIYDQAEKANLDFKDLSEYEIVKHIVDTIEDNKSNKPKLRLLK
jgi:hypothetical protein